MEKSIDHQFIKISGRIEISEQMEIGQEVSLFLKGSIVKTETRDNQDGSVDLLYVIKPTDIEVIKNKS